MELPRALTPWASHIECYPREVIVSLGPAIERLDRVVGPLRMHTRSGLGDLDGFDGITRRGNYERLLISEWLLADEAPEEFARRAAMGEQAFLQLARREPAGSRVSIALFDAGPSQIGGPRIAHLAALIVLARRAEAAGLRLDWGILQRPDLPLMQSITEATVAHLLTARCTREVEDADLEKWKRRLGAGQKVDDLWLIGDARLMRLPHSRDSACLEVHDEIVPDSRNLKLTVQEPDRPCRETMLELPEDAVCARLLRDPFHTETVAPKRVNPKYTPGSNLLFVGGYKLLARSQEGELVVYSGSNSPQGGAGKPKIYMPESREPILAAARIGKHNMVVTLTDEPGRLCLEYQRRNFNIVGDLPDWTPFAGRYTPLYSIYFVRDALGGVVVQTYNALLRIKQNDLQQILHIKQNEMHLIQDESEAIVEAAEVANVSGPIVGEGRVCYAARSAAKGQWVVGSIGGNVVRKFYWMDGLTNEGHVEARAYFGYGGKMTHNEFDLVTVECGRQWRILFAGGEIQLTPPADAQVVGVLGGIQDWKSPALLLLTSGGRTLTLYGQGWTQRLLTATSEIKTVTVNTFKPEIAYTTVQGEVVVYSLFFNANLFRLIPSEMS